MNTQLLRIWLLTKKNITLYFKKGPVIIFGFLFPFFLMLSWIMGRDIAPEVILIGIGSMTVFFTATSISPVVLPIETREHSLERQLASPIRIFDIIMGIVIASTLFSISITAGIFIILAIGFSIPILGIGDILAVIVGLGLIALISSLLGVLISAVPTDATSNVMVLINFVKFPLVFMSGIFIPLYNAALPTIIFGYCSPLSPFVDLLYGAFLNHSLVPSWVNILLLLGWTGLLIGLNVYFHPKTMPKRFSLEVKVPKGGGQKK
jgi:ABC-2 type transport system permease protein